MLTTRPRPWSCGILQADGYHACGAPWAPCLAVRQGQSAPLFANLHSWLEQRLRQVSGKPAMSSAIPYMRARWNALTPGLRAGCACIDSNAAERAICPISPG